MTSTSTLTSLMTPSRPSRTPVRRRLDFGSENDENNATSQTNKIESTDDFLKRSIAEVAGNSQRRFAELYNFDTVTGRPIQKSSEGAYKWQVTKSAPKFYHSVMLRRRQATPKFKDDTTDMEMPDGTFAKSTVKTPTKRRLLTLTEPSQPKKSKPTGLSIRNTKINQQKQDGVSN